ncbi:hypothetical protein EMN47_11015 [Prolixibacteraceae bacterium JC049]|nr:hypothetical protein [Prolixibacteraceae bacterium JC049]
MKRNIAIKQKIVLILLLFSIAAFAGIIYTLTVSSRQDKQHLKLVENSEKIEIKIYNARVELSNYLKSFNVESKDSVVGLLDKVRRNINLIKETVADEDEMLSAVQFRKELSELDKQIVALDSVLVQAIRLKQEKGVNEEMAIYSKAFIRYENVLHRYLKEKDFELKKRVFLLMGGIFIILIGTLTLVLRLMNTLIRTHGELVRVAMTVEHKERKRIARELHDGLGAMLSSMRMYAMVMEKDFQADSKVLNKIRHVKELSKQALDTVAEVVDDLNPSVLNRYDLEESLERLVNKINNFGQLEVVLKTNGLGIQPRKSTQVVLYRICSELINNTLKHANATQVMIELSGDRILKLKYQDNGDGFDFDEKRIESNSGIGLQNIIERVESVGGSWSISTAPQKGFSIKIQFVISQLPKNEK